MAEVLKSCPICNYPDLRERGNGIYQCDFCETYFDKDENIVQTEQEYLQTCTTEQLIRFLLWYPYNVHGYPKPKMSIAEEEDALREWLKQPHKE